VEVVPERIGEKIVQPDLIGVEGNLNIRLFITDGSVDLSVKMKKVEDLANLIGVSDDEVINVLKGDKGEALRMLRDELSGKEIAIFGRGSKFAPDGKELENAWLDIGKFGYIRGI
jgi:hypothetical protein